MRYPAPLEAMPQTLTGLGPGFTTAPFLEKCRHRSAAARGQRLEFTDSASFNGQREFLFHDTYLIAGARVVKMVAEAAENRRRRESWLYSVVRRQDSPVARQKNFPACLGVAHAGRNQIDQIVNVDEVATVANRSSHDKDAHYFSKLSDPKFPQ